MIEVVDVQSILIATMAGALVVLLGAAYAFLFALAKVYRRPGLMPAAYLSYLMMSIAVGTLASALHLFGFWAWLVAVMMLGYLLAPHAIWHLCVGTHKAEDGELPAPLERSNES